jgi:crossover junction endodeoxyribonuclease RusA
VSQIVLPTIFIAGAAKPKGSLRHVGGGRLIEQVIGSKEWKAVVANEARRRKPYSGTYDGAVEVEAIVYVVRPPSAPKSRTLPIKRSAGDSDKHARNILDALAKPSAKFHGAGVYADDAQVTDLIIRKRYATAVHRPGVYLTVRTVDDADVAETS